ncbi:MAG: polysaccharide deacetylase family protein [Chloroflexi bacterium]|nr:polysaccharide deacetylase family protein [Chloroflexota bacterium]
MKKILIVMMGLSILLSGCGTGLFATATPTASLTPLPPTATATVTPTFTATPTATITPSPTAILVFQGPEQVFVPILLFHRIDVSPTGNEYYVTPEMFDEEMQLLSDWGYSTITTELLIKAINEGADLPAHPVLITFDDGHLDNYTNAYPIMKKYGFTGVLYIVANYMGAEDYLNADQIIEMASAGWEVGSHSVNHLDLTKLDPEQQRYEIIESRSILESRLGVPVLTIAYPFGLSNSSVVDYTVHGGYVGAMGLGMTYNQGSFNLFALQRREIKGYYDILKFADLLPWKGDPDFLPTGTPAP